MERVTQMKKTNSRYLSVDKIYVGNAEDLLTRIRPDSVACSIWSPPYHVGKEYEAGQTYEEWQALLRTVIQQHYPIIVPGGFLVINIADILAFPDATMPRIQAENVCHRRSPVTREDVLAALAEHPNWNRYQVAEHLGCSEQTVDRRLHGNNIRGGKYATQTCVKLAGPVIEKFGTEARFYLYDRRIWVKDPAWQNSQWHSLSYRSIDESEYLYIFWKPGITTVDRQRLSPAEWRDWGSRGVWLIPSVRANDDHPAKFPLELPRRVIRLLTAKGDTVLDCFVGSGTTAVAAILEERHYIGIDKEQLYVSMAKEACRRAERSNVQ